MGRLVKADDARLSLGMRARALIVAGLAAVVALAPLAGAAEAPSRVVSMNLCTDQLAMLVAAPGQLASVSVLAQDPHLSAMADEAAGLPTNRGRAEAVFLMRPDLVLAGAFTDPTSIEMLRRLGLRVEVFAPVTELSQIPERLTQMGTLLGREVEAAALVRDFRARLARLEEHDGTGLSAGLYQANGYAPGSRTLAGQIVAAAGLANIADGEGLAHGGFLPLERLVMATPDLLVASRGYAGTSRAEELLDHPVLGDLDAPRLSVAGNDWVCGTPHVLGAVDRLREALP